MGRMYENILILFGFYIVQVSANLTECLEPPHLSNTYRHFKSSPGNSSLSVGATWYFQCVERFENISGDQYRTCLVSGQWEGEDLQCKASSCEPLERPTHGFVMFLSLDIGSNATYFCFEGYMLGFGSKTRTCQDNGDWSGTPPSCEVIKCPTPQPVDHSFMVFENADYNTYVTYTCYPGYYVVQGNLERRCTVAAAWSGSQPHCAKVVCPTPMQKNKAMPSFTSLGWKSTVSYTCQIGTTLARGNLTRTCNDVAEWDGEEPVCEDVYCSDPEPVGNSSVEFSNGDIGAVAVYYCNKGFVKVGGVFISFCQEDGSWSEVTLNCSAVYCGKAPVYIGAKSNSTGEMYNDYATYECFLYPDDETPHWVKNCDRHGNWIGDDPECTAGWYTKKFESEPVEAEGSVWIGIVVLGIFITIIVSIIVLDVATLEHHFVYLRRNLLDFRKTVRKAVRKLLAQPRMIKFSQRFKLIKQHSSKKMVAPKEEPDTQPPPSFILLDDDLPRVDISV